MTDRLARQSMDDEQAPLLSDAGEDTQATIPTSPSYTDRISSIAQEPLTPLTQILLILVLVLLLTTSVFVGLFAGSQHRLQLEREGRGNHTLTATATATATTTSTAISSAVSTATTTQSTTTTVIVPPIPPPTAVPEKPCLEPSCIILSASILESLDLSLDPCENFYDFANGGWLDKHPLPADKSSFGNFEFLAQKNKQVIQKIMESNTTHELGTDYDAALLTKLRNFYASCLNEKRLDEVGSEPLLHFANTVRKLYSGKSTDISSMEKSDDEKKMEGLTAAVAFLHSRGVGALFGFDIEGDVGVDPNNMVLWFNQPSLGLPSKEYYGEDEILLVYRQVVERLLVALADEAEQQANIPRPIVSSAFIEQSDPEVWPPWPWPPWGDDNDPDKDKDKDKDRPKINKTFEIHKLAKAVVEFETKLANASLDLDVMQQDPFATYNPVHLSNLINALPQIHFLTYFSTFTPRAFPDRVILTYPPYAASLSTIINETSSAVVEGYLVVRAALALSPYLSMSTEAWKAQRFLLETLTGIKKGAVGDRAEYCLGRVEASLGFASGRFFVQETFRGNSKNKATKVITDVIKAFKDSLHHTDWMDETSAKAAAEKADVIRVKVGYPISPDTDNPRSIVQYYNKVEVDKDDFFGNVLSSTTTEEFRKWLQLGRRRNPDTWEMYPSTVNAYFNPPANEIVFPAGILQPPFFFQEWPNYMSYGAFGHVASHELTHAFDSAGRLYNQEGKLVKWWTNATSEGFKVKQDCIVTQFSSYSIDDGKGGRIHVNGNLTSGENIGDTGLVQALRAWKAQYKESKEAGYEYLLPGLNFTREQLFFISFARIWARAMKPAAAIQRIRTDPHSPTRFRVDGTLSNIPEFAEAFKCSKKAKLNPPTESRCIFWG